MNTKELTKRYEALTPEERFRLILAASGRGDRVEQDRLRMAARKHMLAMEDHAPYAHAFDEAGRAVYLDLLEDVHRYFDALDRADREGYSSCAEAADDPDHETDDADEEDHISLEDKYFQLILAAGYILRTKADGWKLFCERLHVPPFLAWKDLPGFTRLERALALAEKAAYAPEGFLRWLNSTAPEGMPPFTSVPLTTRGIADEIEVVFRTRVAWWGG